MKQITKSCPNCLKGFKARQDSRVKYCSRECREEYQRSHPRSERKDKGRRKGTYITLVCEICDIPFERLESEAKKRKTYFCSRECYLKGGASIASSHKGRSRKRPGGPGLPPNPQPETLEAHEKWGVYSWFDDRGYILLYIPSCPYAPVSTGRIYEHRLVMSMHENRRLSAREHVDHKNQIPNDNRFENLQILSPKNHSKKTYKENMGEKTRKAELWDSLPDEIKKQFEASE